MSCSITDRSIWIYSTYVEVYWKTEISQPSNPLRRRASFQPKSMQMPNSPSSARRPSFAFSPEQRKLTLSPKTNGQDTSCHHPPKERQQQTFKIGFGHLLWYFLNTTQETQLTKAVELFRVLNMNVIQGGIRERTLKQGALAFPPEHALSNGRRGYFVYQVNVMACKLG